jgi:hypothetical protein
MKHIIAMYHKRMFYIWNWLAHHTRSSKIFSFCIRRTVPHSTAYCEYVRDYQPDEWARRADLREGYNRICAARDRIKLRKKRKL